MHQVTTTDSEWYNKWQQMASSDNECQRVTAITNGAASGNKWSFLN